MCVPERPMTSPRSRSVLLTWKRRSMTLARFFHRSVDTETFLWVYADTAKLVSSPRSSLSWIPSTWAPWSGIILLWRSPPNCMAFLATFGSSRAASRMSSVSFSYCFSKTRFAQLSINSSTACGTDSSFPVMCFIKGTRSAFRSLKTSGSTFSGSTPTPLVVGTRAPPATVAPAGTIAEELLAAAFAASACAFFHTRYSLIESLFVYSLADLPLSSGCVIAMSSLKAAFSSRCRTTSKRFFLHAQWRREKPSAQRIRVHPSFSTFSSFFCRSGSKCSASGGGPSVLAKSAIFQNESDK
mmetsp:Transcript_20027/g.50510  ORF Transcript_20027/g.50510 Transcript_20027/m.50510 type:complete len:298 (+) Transcript_20027:1835-2728(+)